MTRTCSRCHDREATRVLVSGRRKTYFCGRCEPSKLTDFRRLVRLDDPTFARPTSVQVARDAADVARIAQLGGLVDKATELATQFERKLAASEKRVGELEQQLADGARAFKRVEENSSALSGELSRQLRAAEYSSAQWETRATELQAERDTALERLGKAATARDDAQAQLATLRRQMQTPARVTTPAPVAVAVAPPIPDAPNRRRLTDLVATTLPLRGVRPLAVRPEVDLIYAVLPADNRSKIAQAVRDYLCGRRLPGRARGLDDSGRQTFTLGAGRFTVLLSLDERDGFLITDLAESPR